MTQEEILEGNLLISEFLEDEINTNRTEVYPKGSYGCGGCYSVENLRYHYSLDWLIPVVEKISEKKVDVSISRTCGYDLWHCSISDPYEQPPYIHNRSNIMIETVWLAVVDFVKWYNKQKVLNQ